MTTIPTITALPTPSPQTSDPTNFATRGDALLTALPTMVTEQNLAIAATNTVAGEVATDAEDAAAAAASAIASSTVIATVSTSLSLTTGGKSISWAETGRAFVSGRQATLIRASDRTQKMWGALSSVDNTAKTATLTVATSDDIAGSGGPYTDWILVDAWIERLAEATVAQVHAKTAHVAVSPDVARDADAAVALTMGATVTVDGSTGLRRTLSCNGNFTLAAPTNVDPGDIIEIDVTHTAGSNVMAVNSALKRPNGLGALSTTNGHRDLILILVQTVDGSRTCTRGIYQVIRNPT